MAFRKAFGAVLGCTCGHARSSISLPSWIRQMCAASSPPAAASAASTWGTCAPPATRALTVLVGHNGLSTGSRSASSCSINRTHSIAAAPGAGGDAATQSPQKGQQQSQTGLMHLQGGSSRAHVARLQQCSSRPCSNSQQLGQHIAARGMHTSSHIHSSNSSSSSDAVQQPASVAAPSPASILGLQHLQGVSDDDIDALMTVLLQPMPSSPAWNSQLNHVLVGVGDQQLVEPRQVLLSLLRALHVVRAVLAENGHIYVLGSHPVLKPLLEAASRSCINSNVWFLNSRWRPGTLTNYVAHQRLFKAEHQPNRQLLAAKGLALVNPLCPQTPPLQTRPARLAWADKWALYSVKHRRSEMEELLRELIVAEDRLHKFKPPGSLRGEARHLSLMVVLDSSRNTHVLREAYQVNVPTVALVNPITDLSRITYPVLARDFHPGFVHFFLDWLIKVVNVPPSTNAGG